MHYFLAPIILKVGKRYRTNEIVNRVEAKTNPASC